MSKHTPGPWIMDEDDSLCVGTPKGWYPRQVYKIVTVLEGGEDYTDEHNAEALADARLIAAAPDLLGALELAREEIQILAEALDGTWWEDGKGGRRKHSGHLNSDVQEIITTAIARATGSEVPA